MQVDFKAGVMLDAEYIADVAIATSSVDSKGRTRYEVSANLYPATDYKLLGEEGPESSRVLTAGTAIFVQTDRPWPGQVGTSQPASL
jgi:hypothetical protein